MGASVELAYDIAFDNFTSLTTNRNESCASGLLLLSLGEKQNDE